MTHRGEGERVSHWKTKRGGKQTGRGERKEGQSGIAGVTCISVVEVKLQENLCCDVHSHPSWWTPFAFHIVSPTSHQLLFVWHGLLSVHLLIS